MTDEQSEQTQDAVEQTAMDEPSDDESSSASEARMQHPSSAALVDGCTLAVKPSTKCWQLAARYGRFLARAQGLDDDAAPPLVLTRDGKVVPHSTLVASLAGVELNAVGARSNSKAAPAACRKRRRLARRDVERERGGGRYRRRWARPTIVKSGGGRKHATLRKAAGVASKPWRTSPVMIETRFVINS